MTRLLDWWRRFWFADVPPHVYALLRIAVGVAGCVTMIGLGDVPMLLAIDGLAPAPGGGLGVRAALQEAGLGTAAGWGLFAANAVAFACLLVGWRTGAASVLAFIASTILIWWNPWPLSAGQHLLHMLTLYLLFADSGAVWSLDARRARRRGTALSARLSVWPLRLLQAQVCLMYVSAALWKLLDPTWRDGSALHYALNFNAFQRFPGEVPAALDPLLVAMTWLTLAWEAAFLPAMITRATRHAVVILGAVLHLGMWGLLEIGPFSLTVLAAYTAFLEPDWVARFDPLWSATSGAPSPSPSRPTASYVS